MVNYHTSSLPYPPPTKYLVGWVQNRRVEEEKRKKIAEHQQNGTALVLLLPILPLL